MPKIKLKRGLSISILAIIMIPVFFLLIQEVARNIDESNLRLELNSDAKQISKELADFIILLPIFTEDNESSVEFAELVEMETCRIIEEKNIDFEVEKVFVGFNNPTFINEGPLGLPYVAVTLRDVSELSIGKGFVYGRGSTSVVFGDVEESRVFLNSLNKLSLFNTSLDIFGPVVFKC